MQGPGFRVQEAGFRVQGSGFRVQGLLQIHWQRVYKATCRINKKAFIKVVPGKSLSRKSHWYSNGPKAGSWGAPVKIKQPEKAYQMRTIRLLSAETPDRPLAPIPIIPDLPSFGDESS